MFKFPFLFVVHFSEAQSGQEACAKGLSENLHPKIQEEILRDQAREREINWVNMIKENRDLLAGESLVFFGNRLVLNKAIDFDQATLDELRSKLTVAIRKRERYAGEIMPKGMNFDRPIFGLISIFVSPLDLLSELEDRVAQSSRLDTATRVELLAIVREKRAAVQAESGF